jgi:hypothetical protein
MFNRSFDKVLLPHIIILLLFFSKLNFYLAFLLVRKFIINTFSPFIPLFKFSPAKTSGSTIRMNFYETHCTILVTKSKFRRLYRHETNIQKNEVSDKNMCVFYLLTVSVDQ